MMMKTLKEMMMKTLKALFNSKYFENLLKKNNLGLN